MRISRTRSRIRLVVLLVAAVRGSKEECAWCEAGACADSGNVVKDVFELSISPLVGGRGFPYWRPSGQSRLGVSSNASVVFLIQHGADRNGDDYTKYAMGSAPKSALVFGTQMYEAEDEGLDQTMEIWWNTNTDDGWTDDSVHDWHWGGDSTEELPATLSSFEVLDEIIETLFASCPRLENVIVGGHSAGGQLIQRYALLTKLNIDARVRYFVANPSSLAWLDSTRPYAANSNDYCCDNTTILEKTKWDYLLPSQIHDCPNYDKYGYGLSASLPRYVNRTNNKEEALAKSIRDYQYRDVTYLSGESDVCDSSKPICSDCAMDDGGLDTSCEAFTQGPCRMARIHAFAYFVQEKFYATAKDVHHFVSVPNVGHSGCGMFQSTEFQRTAFSSLDSSFGSGEDYAHFSENR